MSGVLQGFTVIFIVIAVGVVLGRTEALGPGATMVLSRLVFFVCTPALLFSSLAKADIADVFSTTLVVSGGSALLLGAVYFAIARLLLRRDVPEATIGALSASYVNCANLGIPIAIFVLDDASFVAPLLLFQIMVYSPLALTMLDLTALDRRDEDGNRRRISLRETVITPFTNPIVLGGVAGLLISVTGLDVPHAVMEPFDMLGNASVPGALLVFGLSLTGVAVLQKGSSPRRDVALATVLKMIAQPVLVYVMARFLFDAGGHELFSLVVIAALPTAQSVLVYATRYQRGVVLARDAALVTTLLSVPGIALIALLLA